MKLFYFVILLPFGLLPVSSSAQSEEKRANPGEYPTEEPEIYLQVLRPTGLEDAPIGTEILWEQLKEAVVLNDLHATISPFVLETHIRLLSCQTTPSVPIQWIAEMEILCSITDRIRGRVLQQTSFHPKGIASDKKKAILTALKQIKARHPQLKKLILGGKEKILPTRKNDKSPAGEATAEPFSSEPTIVFFPVGGTWSAGDR